MKYVEIRRKTAKDGERRRQHGKDGENTGRTAKTRDRRRKHGRACGRGDGENKGFMKLSSENLFSLILLGASHTKETCLGSPGMTCGCGALSAAPAINVEVSPDSLRAELCRSVSHAKGRRRGASRTKFHVHAPSGESKLPPKCSPFQFAMRWASR